MKKIIYLALGATALFVASCKKNDFKADSVDKIIIPGGSNPDTLVGEVTVDTVITKNTVLQGFVFVKPGRTLTINPGVTIFGSTGNAIPDPVNYANNKGTLCVEKGGKIIANGTATQPIIWTSSKPVGSRYRGDWGGLVIYGLATMHNSAGASTGFYEAFDFNPSDTRNTYGGTNDADNSGSVKFNRFEFGGGVVYTINKEVNGVTLCGVGSGTVINNIETLHAGDDSYEFFGGAVNADHLLAFDGKDDQFDFDEGYHGKLQFIIGYNGGDADNSGSHLIESDNDALATNNTPVTNAFIANATLVGPTVAKNWINLPNADTNLRYYDGGLMIRRNSRLTFVNSCVAAQKQPFLYVATPTTVNRVAFTPSLSDSIVFSYNLLQHDSLFTKGVVSRASGEGNPVPLTLVNSPSLISSIGSAANANGVANTYADIKIDGVLKPVAGSPLLSGGANLAALGLPFFVGTTQRGAIRTTDVWTLGAWISIAAN